MKLVCFSHLPWNFVYQRPQHLLSRFTLQYKVYYVQEFHFLNKPDGYSIEMNEENVWIVIPHLNDQVHVNEIERKRQVIDNLFYAENISTYILWYYTPMSLLFSDHLIPIVTVYDCMDELSAFKFADSQLKNAEDYLFEKADVVFTGGNSLYEAKKHKHHNVHSFASSIDKDHFSKARYRQVDFADQHDIPQPRFGFYGVIDERFDIELIKDVADSKPEWHFVLIGPVVKIDYETLPRRENIHYLGTKSYKDLPHYLSGWDIAIIPFAINESTRYISPTKTPEYLAGGKPVISTPITDVKNPYEIKGLVHIANDAAEFIDKAAKELQNIDKDKWLEKVDLFLTSNSWTNTWFSMHDLIVKELNKKYFTPKKKTEAYV